MSRGGTRYAALASFLREANTSGFATRRNISREFGIPSRRHCDTAASETSQSVATSLVPPRASMTLHASLSIPGFKHTEKKTSTPLNRPQVACLTMSLAKRIKEALADAGMSKSDLARAVGVSPSAVTQWENGDTKILDGGNLVSAAQALGVSPDWLATGKGDKNGGANTAVGPLIRAKVPLISWATAGRWAEVSDPHPAGEGEDWVPTTAKVGPNAFALRVVGDSMEPKIPDGSIVIIDPARSYKHGSIVLAKRTSDQEATLKQLWYDGATPKLKPLNDRYQILDMPKDTRIIGVAVRLELDL